VLAVKVFTPFYQLVIWVIIISLTSTPGETKFNSNQKFAYLVESEITTKIIDYTDSEKAIVSFYVPSIHCSSCIWLLERLYTLHSGIIKNRVDFLKKQVFVQFRHDVIGLKVLAELRGLEMGIDRSLL
jgi:Cu+-exporting ATPase